MGLCLYHPEFGYYARAPYLGRQGDFFTSPCVHPVFGAAVASQILEIWELLGCPEDFVIVEAGAGEGYLALDILDYLKRKGNVFPYYISEPFPASRTRQEEILSPHKDLVTWVSDLSELPSFTGVFVSNELFDAFPVHLVEMTEEGLKEVYVVVGERPVESLGGLSTPEILRRVSSFVESWPEGYRTEVCLAIEPYFKEIAKRLVRGAIITFDYGYSRADYYHPDRYRGTLLCYAGHRVVEDPYQAPGRMDITAHVDFTTLKELGERYGLVNIGFTQQAAFLVGLGVEKLLGEISSGRTRDIEALKMLIMPQGLGTSHWVLVQGRGLPLGEVSKVWKS
jgi:SAM-dependent MidA family methyltransferase